MLTASLAFHPFGSCSKARRSALLLLLEPARFKILPLMDSFLFLGRPRSIMLPASDWFLLCPVLIGGALCGGSVGSALGVTDASEAPSFGVLRRE